MFFIKDDEQKSRFSFVKELTYPLMTTSDYMKNFLTITCFFAIVVALINILLGRASMCGLEYSGADVKVFCSSNIYNSIISILINLVGISLYINRVGLIKNKQEKIFWFLQKMNWKQELKAFFVVCLYLLFWVGLCVLGVLLKTRHPTTDWKVELCFFVAISLGMIVLMFLIVMFVGFLHYLHGGHFFEIKKIFWPIFDEIFKPITCFFIYLIIFSFLFVSVYRYFVKDLGFVSVVLCEFCMFFILYFMMAMIYFSLEYQEKILFSEEK